MYSYQVPNSKAHIPFLLEIQKVLSATNVDHKQALDIETQESNWVFTSEDNRLSQIIHRLSERESPDLLIKEFYQPSKKMPFPAQAQLIRELRQSQNLILKDFGVCCGIKTGRVRKLEMGAVEITLSEAYRMHGAFGVKLFGDHFMARHNYEAVLVKQKLPGRGGKRTKK